MSDPASKSCIHCGGTSTPQWYAGPSCKPCYRRRHRRANVEQFKTKDAARYERDRDKILAQAKDYYQANKEAVKARTKAHRQKVGDQRRPGYMAEYRAANPDKVRGWTRDWIRRNPQRAREVWNNWNKRHPQYRAHMTSLRRARINQATPPWLTQSQMDEILTLFESCLKGYHIDHIVPLRGQNVCGLHVPWNLRAIPALENLIKYNKLLAI